MIHALAFALVTFIRLRALPDSRDLGESVGEVHEKFSGHVEVGC